MTSSKDAKLHSVQTSPQDLPLWRMTGSEYYDFRRLQIVDPETDAMRRLWYVEEYGPLTFVAVDQIWQELGVETVFEASQWEYFEQYFGTTEMHADPAHQEALHGDDHLARVLLYAYILGRYKGISDSEMKVLLTAASVHDRARTDDRDALHHGKDAAENFNHDKEYEIEDENGIHKHTVPAYITTYKKRGITFEDSEISQIEQLCEYHEVPWEQVPQELDERTRLLIQILQIADAADRFRSPSTKWWPDPKFMRHFFQDETGQILEDQLIALLHFTASFTLLSEQRRFEEGLAVYDAIRTYAQEVGIVIDNEAEGNTSTRRPIGV